MKEIADDCKDLSKQLNGYADAITGFALIQCVAFCYSILRYDPTSCIAVKSIKTVYFLNVASTCAYLLGLSLCYRGHDKLIPAHTLSREILYVRKRLRYLRLTIVLAAGLFALYVMYFVKSQGFYNCGA
jgi:hypothetical protein